MNEIYVIMKQDDGLLGALVDENSKALSFEFQKFEEESIVGNIYVGNVSNVSGNLEAVFVDIPGVGNAYLEKNNIEDPIFVNTRQEGPLRQGDLIIVQAVSDPIKKKLPSVTTKITLSGKNAVIVPQSQGLFFSKKFKDQDKKEQIKEKYSNENFEGYKVVIRTAATETNASRVISEAKDLKKKWEDALQSAKTKKKAMLIFQELPLLLRKARDVGNAVTDDMDSFGDLVANWVRTRWYENKDVSLGSVYNIDAQLQEALSKKVWLKSGAFIVIEPTEALVSIDVNSGKSEKGKNSQDQFFKTNMEAAKEVARQIVLRNLSGIIVVDFINMESEEDNQALLKEMKELLKCDPLGSSVVEMTKLGLLEITRKKERQPLYEIMDI